MYDVIHPVTGKVCKKPVSGWRYSNPKRLQEEVEKGHVVFGPDETTVPRVRLNLFEQSSEVMRSVHFSYAQTATNEFLQIFEGKRVFDNPKGIGDIKQLVAYITEMTGNDIVLDFFSGSATTAHAVMQQNAEDGGNRQFIMVQLPEQTNEKSEAYKAGYKNICEIGKERIRRAGKKIKGESPLTTQDLDIGFRVLKLDSSNMKDVYYNPADVTRDMFDMMTDNIKEDRTPEDLLFQVMLDRGIPLSSKIEESIIAGKKVFNVEDNFLIACFDQNLTDDVIKAIARKTPYYFVMRDSSMADDSVAANFDQIFAAYSPDTDRKVI